jgi:hypothetical protein
LRAEPSFAMFPQLSLEISDAPEVREVFAHFDCHITVGMPLSAAAYIAQALIGF